MGCHIFQKCECWGRIGMMSALGMTRGLKGVAFYLERGEYAQGQARTSCVYSLLKLLCIIRSDLLSMPRRT